MAERGVKQKGELKTARIPIKIVPVDTPLKKPEWIRVKAGNSAGRSGQPVRGDAPAGQPIDDGLLEAMHQFAHLEFAPGEIEQHIDHRLPGAVVGDLAAAVDGDDRDADVAEQVFTLAGLPEGKDRRVLDDPQFVRCFRRAGGGEMLHGLPARHVVCAAEAAQQKAHNTTLTSGCELNSR